MVFPVANSPLIEKYRGQYINAQLTIKERNMFLVIQIAEKKRDVKFVGIDGGIKNTAVLSKLFNSKRGVKVSI
ncbi:MAG: hypothetical protein QXO68_00385 [Conexivisphaerales archaeon]